MYAGIKIQCLNQLGEAPTEILASPEGLEPPLTVLETAVLPLHQRDTNLVDRRGIEPLPEACKATVLPLSLPAHIFKRTVANACIKEHSLSQFYAL